jgi:peptidoglycan/LPS O-acetylase OafA/YrhL
MSYVDKSIHIISPGKSDFLNFVRFAAAMLVVFGHADMYLGQFGGNPEKWTSFGYLGAHSHSAVMVFFVLSGYVVAYATAKKVEAGSYGFREYFLDRWSRIYSVLLFAIVFTLVIDFIGGSLSPKYRDPSLIPQTDFALRLISNIFALNGIQGHRIQLGSNPALWSIGYEFIFYLMYGLLFFKRQLFRQSWLANLIFTLALRVIGWKMTVYFGVWLMGVWAYRVSRASPIACFKISPWILLFTLIVANHIINFSNVLGLTEIFQDILFAVVIAALLVADCPPPTLNWRTTINAYLAEFSYSLYAFHMPLIFFLCSLFFTEFFQHMPRFFPGVLLVLASLVLGRIFFILGESRRTSFRRIGDRALTKLAI